MKILVLGATGMLGHKLLQHLSRDHTVFGTIRRNSELFKQFPCYKKCNLIGNIDAFNLKSFTDVIHKIKPDVVINSIGIVKQLPESQDPITSIHINSLLPHQLAKISKEINARFIHYSTDCVFSGKIGNYSESDFPDARDLYGLSKMLGEVNGPQCLTLRTSIIGRELTSSHGLVEWFLSQNEISIQGYKNAIFSGLTTIEHAKIVEKIIVDYPNLNGLFHLASDPISKFDLLQIVKKYFNVLTIIEPNFKENINRSLDSSKFKTETNISIPRWSEMVKEMYIDPTPYTELRRMYALK